MAAVSVRLTAKTDEPLEMKYEYDIVISAK
jgi:hypothetical protein